MQEVTIGRAVTPEQVDVVFAPETGGFANCTPGILYCTAYKLIFGDVRRTQTAKREFFLFHRSDEDDFTIKSIESTSPYLTASAAPSPYKGGPGFLVTATLSPGAPLGAAPPGAPEAFACAGLALAVEAAALVCLGAVAVVAPPELHPARPIEMATAGIARRVQTVARWRPIGLVSAGMAGSTGSIMVAMSFLTQPARRTGPEGRPVPDWLRGGSSSMARSSTCSLSAGLRPEATAALPSRPAAALRHSAPPSCPAPPCARRRLVPGVAPPEANPRSGSAGRGRRRPVERRSGWPSGRAPRRSSSPQQGRAG